MLTGLLEITGREPQADEYPAHILVVVKSARDRLQVVGQLQAAGYLVTTTAGYGLVEFLLEHADQFDLLLTAQSIDEMAHFGLPQLARSVDPDLPIVLLDSDAARGQGVVEAVQSAVLRWPMRERPRGCLH